MACIQLDTYHDNRITSIGYQKNGLFVVELAEINPDQLTCTQLETYFSSEETGCDSFQIRTLFLFKWLINNYAKITDDKIYVVTNDLFVKNLIKQINKIHPLLNKSSILRQKQKEMTPFDFAKYLLLNYGVVRSSVQYLDEYIQCQSEFIQVCIGTNVKELIYINTPTNKKKSLTSEDKGGYDQLAKLMYKQHSQVAATTLKIGDNMLGLTSKDVKKEIEGKFAKRRSKKESEGQ